MFSSRVLMTLLLSAASILPVAAAPVYVGSFEVDDGPNWTTNPLSYSAREAAALVFGGSPTDYYISIDSSLNPLSITMTGWYTTWGISGGQVYNHDFKLQTGSGYNDPGGANTAISAYTDDNATGSQYTNYVWLADTQAVPEPSTYALLVSGLGGMLLIARRRRV